MLKVQGVRMGVYSCKGVWETGQADGGEGGRQRAAPLLRTHSRWRGRASLYMVIRGT